MKKHAMTLRKPSKVPMKRVPRPIIALAAPSTMQPTTSIERKLKGGELSWGLTAPAQTIERSIDRALAAAKRLIMGCIELETFERTLRLQQSEISEHLEASLEKVKNEKEAGK